MGTAERRQRERERKEKEITEAARGFFFSKGYDSTSVDDIAERLELSKGTIYLYFANKEELYFAVAKDGLLIVRGMFEKAMAGPGNGLERLMAIGRAYIEFWSSQPEYRRLFHDTVTRTSPLQSGPRGAEFARIGAEANGLMVVTIKQGIADGSIRPDADPEKLAFCASSMVDGILDRTERMGKNKGDEVEREKMLTYAFDLVGRAMANLQETSIAAGSEVSGAKKKNVRNRP